MAGEFSATTKDLLKQRNAFRCANPDCRHYTLGPKISGGLYTTGEAAHIEGKEPGAARYNPNQTPAQRSDIANAIWLCTRCHSMVDPDALRFPVSLLLKWKDMSENLLDYSAPVIAFAKKCFFLGKSPWPPNQCALGGHLTVGPTNLDGVCSDCWMEGLDSSGRFKLNVDRYYRNDDAHGRKKPVPLDDWHPFLSKKGLDDLVYFSGPAGKYKEFLAYRVGVTYQIMGQDFAFRSLWQFGKLTRYQEEIYHLDRRTAPALDLVLDWLFARPESDEAKRMLPIFDYPKIWFVQYSWTDAIHLHPATEGAWKDDGNGVSVCLGEIPDGVTFGFIHQKLKAALVVSTGRSPNAALIKTDGPTIAGCIE